jgi:hypothetical protein
MPLPEHIGQPKSLGHFIQHLADLPPWSWLYIPEPTRQITFAVQCFPKTADSRDMSESEADGFDASIAAAGLKCFLCRSQIEDIVANLRQQRAAYGDSELEDAINFYWQHDAFREHNGEVA